MCEPGEACHNEDMNNTPSLHAHITTESADCDGRHGYDYVEIMNKHEVSEFILKDGVNDFSDYMFKERILGRVVSFHADAVIKTTENGFDYHEPTDEGYTATEVLWCEDEDCDPWMTTSYDQFAEAAGY